MALGEFDLIEKYFTRPTPHAAVGIGDDCALLRPTPGTLLATSTDMLVEGRHFLSTVQPDRLGHKALAVNLSDLAAVGAQPIAFTLALALPLVDETFLRGFSQGLFRLAEAHRCELIGGDTTRGPLNICITVFGETPAGGALLRSGAKEGDDLWVSGTLGDARLALEVFRGAVSLPGEAFEQVRIAMECPQPRVALGMALRGVASAAIDLSDGLMGDLRHILARSGVGATLMADAIPRSACLAAQPLPLQRLCTLAGGDDYELLFTAPVSMRDAVEVAGASAATPVTRIGRIEPLPGMTLVDASGSTLADHFVSFDHFKS
ncbi:MAG: thiamine-phosphate kinase [Rhizobacter sp.]|nr:thiamine-phosphate kinase [Rhizobacter sp.]